MVFSIKAIGFGLGALLARGGDVSHNPRDEHWKLFGIILRLGVSHHSSDNVGCRIRGPKQLAALGRTNGSSDPSPIFLNYSPNLAIQPFGPLRNGLSKCTRIDGNSPRNRTSLPRADRTRNQRVSEYMITFRKYDFRTLLLCFSKNTTSTKTPTREPAPSNGKPLANAQMTRITPNIEETNIER